MSLLADIVDEMDTDNNKFKINRKKDRYVLSEFMETDEEGNYVPGRMIRKGNWKYISYAGKGDNDLLFNLKEDPAELINVRDQNPDIAAELEQLLYKDWEVKKLINRHQIIKKHHQILNKWGEVVQPEEEERWKIPEKARKLPVIR